MQNVTQNAAPIATSSTMGLEATAPAQTLVQTPVTLEVVTPVATEAAAPATPEAPAPETETPPATQEATPQKAKINRVAVKVKRSKGSFRPGKVVVPKAVTKNNVVTKTLKVFVPSKDGITCDQEFVGVRNLAVDLAQAGGITVKSVGFTNNVWEAVLDLTTVAGAATDNDQLLSDTFRSLNETITTSDILQNGFQPLPRPSWAFVIKDFVADRDTF